MPRLRQPPGVGPALTILTFFLLPSVLVAAQQQQNPHGNLRVESVQLKQPSYHAPRRPPNTLLSAETLSAQVETSSSAPAPLAVRDLPKPNNAAFGVSRSGARSLQDWQVEDFVLLATVDGHIHARDRYTGEEIWELAGKPMLETIYNVSHGKGSNNASPFVWIVEPREDGALYVLTPGPYPVLQNLGLTVKQLTDIAPYSSDDGDLPVVWNVEKKTFMLLVDASTGVVKQSFSPGGTFSNENRCTPESKDFCSAHGRDSRGVIDIGQTEYTVTIHNRNTNEHLCTIKYAEWSPNSRDKDLQLQYAETMDSQYMYSRNGEIVAYNYNRRNPVRRPVFTQPIHYPAARVFDVARPSHDESAEAPLVLLPQPVGPLLSDDKANYVLLNKTDSGAWYALSESGYPTVTEGAPEAACYGQSGAVNWDGPFFLPEQKSLIGVHQLDFKVQRPSMLKGIGPGPTTYRDHFDRDPGSTPPTTSPMEPGRHETDNSQQRTTMESQPTPRFLIASFLTFILVAGCFASYQLHNRSVDFSWSKLMQSKRDKEISYPVSAEPAAPLEAADEVVKPLENERVLELSIAKTPHESVSEQATSQDSPEKKVTFDVPDEYDDLSPSHATTVGPKEFPTTRVPTIIVENDKETQVATNDTGSPISDQAAAPATPKKKKAHRGKRGGRKINRNSSKDEDEVSRIIDAAKQLEAGPRLQPDEMTVNGEDMQDVSNIKRIGKLTIDQDKLLGNGSGGTFVFEGKWNERVVAVKRMLPQYFGLAEQEVKLLQESDLHPNVIRYFDDEKDENFLYIAVELCQASLFDLYRDGRPGEELTDVQQRLVNEINANAQHALYQLANGLDHLHSLRIIHRDIKPQNILIAQPKKNENGLRLVISDFGLCKTLPDNVSTLVGTTGNAGTIGWKAPELITQPKDLLNGSSNSLSRDSTSSTDPVAQGVKRAVDIFSLGCVFFYVLTNGCHPFDDEEGWMQIREYNIKKEKANLDQLRLGDDSEEPHHLIQWMLKTNPEHRPAAVQVMNHPFFWSDEKRLNFLCDCSDHWEREPRDPPSEPLARLEDFSTDVIGSGAKRNFLTRLDHAFVNSLGKQRKYTGDRLLDLLRALRNKKNHYEDMDESVKAKVGSLPSGYLRHWTIRFPRLLMSCYEAVGECGLAGESRFRPYFEGKG